MSVATLVYSWKCVNRLGAWMCDALDTIQVMIFVEQTTQILLCYISVDCAMKFVHCCLCIYIYIYIYMYIHVFVCGLFHENHALLLIVLFANACQWLPMLTNTGQHLPMLARTE